MKCVAFILLTIFAGSLGAASFPVEKSPTPEAMAKMIPNYEQWETFLLKAAQQSGLPPKPEWLRERLDWFWRDALMHPLTIEWKSFAGNLLRGKQARQDVDFKNDSEKKAKVKLLKAGGWEYTDSVPATNPGINQCWVKHRTTKTDVSQSATSVAVETRSMSYQTDMWFQYVWDAECNCWAPFTAEQKRQVQAQAETEYEQHVRARIAELKAASAKGPRKTYLDLATRAATAYNKLAEQAAAETDPKKKEEIEYRLHGDWKSAFGSVLDAYQDALRATALDAHLKEFRTIPWEA